jgi:hypothetical protein
MRSAQQGESLTVFIAQLLDDFLYCRVSVLEMQPGKTLTGEEFARWF